MIYKLKAKKRPPVYENLRHITQYNADEYPNKNFYAYRRGNEIKTLSYAKYNSDINALGTAFFKYGLAGKRFVIIGDTCPEYMISFISAISCGGCSVPLDRDISDDEIINFINISEACAVIYTDIFNNRLIKRSSEMKNVKMFIPIMPETEEIKANLCYKFYDILQYGREEIKNGNNSFINFKPDMNKLAVLFFTSGTTGTSKGVMISHFNLISAVNASIISMELDYTNTFVDLLPIHHSYEITCAQLGICGIGGSMFINDSLKNTMKNILEFKPTTLAVVPLYAETMYKRIWAEIDKKRMTKKVRLAMKLSDSLLSLGIDLRDKIFAEIRKGLGGNLRCMICGGAPLSPKLIKDFYSFGIILLEGYGITECAPLVAVNHPDKIKYRSVGQAVFGCNVKIDISSGDITDEGIKTGEILVQGNNVMMGYYKNEEATAEVLTDDGWFRTGDIGYMDDEGYIYITGRKKNIIILSNGKNIYPEELEEYLSKNILIEESVIISRKSEKGDIEITAVIYPCEELRKTKTADEIKIILKDIINNINRSLPVYKQIRQIELRSEPFEKTSSRKIKRFLIK